MTMITCIEDLRVLAQKRVIASGSVQDVLRVDHPFIKTFFLGERGRRALAPLMPEELLHGKS